MIDAKEFHYDGLLRRKLLSVGAAGLIAASTGTRAVGGPSAPMPGGPVDLSPDGKVDLFVRTLASRKEEDVPNYYTGRIYAQIGDASPQLLFSLEGCETYWIRQLDEHRFLLGASTYSYFTDPRTSLPVEEYRNPFTGEINIAQPSLYRNDSATLIDRNGVHDYAALDKDATPLRLDITVAGDQAWLMHDQGNPLAPQPHLEMGVVFFRSADMHDSGLDNIPAFGSATFVSNFPRWMNMGKRPGHLIWFVGSRKLHSISELPSAYLARARAKYPNRLTARPGTP